MLIHIKKIVFEVKIIKNILLPVHDKIPTGYYNFIPTTKNIV